RPEWLLEFATGYYDLATFPDGETKRALQRVLKKKSGKGDDRDDGRAKKKSIVRTHKTGNGQVRKRKT
ncbi:hypothetical protein FA95DRAFT_1613857, partial [Auriscalpium vulgare]